MIRTTLDIDITKCKWIDCLGRVVRIRKNALGELCSHLSSMNENGLKDHSKQLRTFLIDLCESGSENVDFIFDVRGKDLPIPVFSSVTPKKAVPFLLHMMLTLGNYETELDFRMQPTLILILSI